MKAASLLTLCVAFAGCENDPSLPNREYMPDMVTSSAYEAFSPNPLTKDGRTMMAPPAGTIARSQEPFAFGVGPEEAARAGRSLDNPIPENDIVHKRGAIAFARWCGPCHGLLGQGDGPITRLFPRPPSLTATHAQDLADGQLFHIMTLGQGVMPAYAQQIEPRDRWIIVHHIRKLQYDAQVQLAQMQPQPAAIPPAPAPADKDGKEAKKVTP
ncbi:MAG: cytochrome c [Deltaproteobacteria bacterium]|nr:cytochrome c [Deltaproteobacteria bacterium]